ncbi:MAG: DUF2309 domain-containing protein [Pirellulaceae bacterium]
MSIAPQEESHFSAQTASLQTLSHGLSTLDSILDRIQSSVMPVWPLERYVAVNPFAGLADFHFLDAHQHLQKLANISLMVPRTDFYQQFLADGFDLSDLETAIDEMVEDETPQAEFLSAKAILQSLVQADDTSEPSHAAAGIRSIAAKYDACSNTNWVASIRNEVSKFCSSHYDQGQSRWPSPWRHLPLYQAWRSAALQDRHMEILGLKGFRQFVAALPHDPKAAIAYLLQYANVPEALWQDYLSSLLFEIPGWSAWAKFQSSEVSSDEASPSDLEGLLAIRLAYDVSVSQVFRFQVDYRLAPATADIRTQVSQDWLERYALLKAMEVRLRNRLLQRIQLAPLATNSNTSRTDRKLATLVFCIDVRSERIRRHLESATSRISTVGFAGFFGLPLELVRFGESKGMPQLPVVAEPAFQIHESCCDAHHGSPSDDIAAKRLAVRSFRKSWKRMQQSAVSCYGFVESTGLTAGLQLLGRTLKLIRTPQAADDGLSNRASDQLSLNWNDVPGCDLEQQVALAEGILRTMGLTDNFARLIVFVGHFAETENNPLNASLACGACGGQSGEPNARLAASLLNRSEVRQLLKDKGITIPHDTLFVAGTHNTTTDEVTLLGRETIPASHHGEFDSLSQTCQAASMRTRLERCATLSASGPNSLVGRSVDWSEVRPEWGLAGNWGLVIGPRSLTKNIDLQGRTFLHEYAAEADHDGTILRQILAGPVVVANWINLQYYASAVAPEQYSSGNKTVQNVVGQFGILSGNGGDLQTGLPWQSIHTGAALFHQPVRLSVIVQSPRQRLADALAENSSVRTLAQNGWLHLICVDHDRMFRLAASGRWNAIG